MTICTLGMFHLQKEIYKKHDFVHHDYGKKYFSMSTLKKQYFNLGWHTLHNYLCSIVAPYKLNSRYHKTKTWNVKSQSTKEFKLLSVTLLKVIKSQAFLKQVNIISCRKY